MLIAAGCGGLTGAVSGPLSVTVLASGLDFPWAMAFTSDGRLFFTERNSGHVRAVAGGVLQAAPLLTLSVCCSGEGGLLGLAADPGFATNAYLYVYYTYMGAGGPTNRIQRLIVSGNSATADLIVLDNIPGGSLIHNGGRLKVGPDGMLYASDGDTGNDALAQDPSSLAGKIIRLTRTGGVPPDNPSPGTYVYTLGHRNPQGLAWDASGAMYATEHGPASNDEVNRVLPGRNYGWPTIVGQGGNPAYKDPLFLFFPDTCAPSGATFVISARIPEWNGDLLFTCLRGAHLHRLRMSGAGSETVVTSEALFNGTYGRMRDVVVGPDGAAYVVTSNGGGTDRLLRIGR